MTRLLHVISSPRAEQSDSLAIANTFVDAYVQAHPEAEVDTLNLWADPVPTFDGNRVAAKMNVIGGQTLAGEQATAWDDIVAHAERFTAADLYVFGVPMWNFGIPWILKHYIDAISHPGLLFGIDAEKGYYPLLADKTAVTVYTAGLYAEGVPPQWGVDFQSTYIRGWLQSIGVSPVHEIRFQPTMAPVGGPPEERRVVALDEARQLAEKI